jgi:TrmH family RNA methyltransferase
MFTELSTEDKEKHIRDKCYEKCRFSGKGAAAVRLVSSVQNNTRANPEKLVSVEGIWETGLLLRYGVVIKAVFLSVNGITSPEAYQIVIRLIEAAEEVHIVSESTFGKMAEIGTSAGILTLARFPQKKLDFLDQKAEQLLIVLDGLEIPGNIGTIIRSCDGTDTDAVIICNRKTRLSHPKLIRSSQGSCFKVPVIEDEAEAVIGWLIKNGYRIILTDTASDHYYYEDQYQGKIAIVMGSERYGISRPWYQIKADGIKIPMFGDCDSLNVGIAATMILYEAAIKRKAMLQGLRG